MQKRDHTQLWNGILNYKFDQFWSVNRRLMRPDLSPSPSSSTNFTTATTTTNETASTVHQNFLPSSSGHCFRHIPYRIYLISQGDAPIFYQKLIKPTLEPTSKSSSDHNQHEPRLLRHLLEDVLKLSAEEIKTHYRVVTHGIEPHFDTPLQWMSEHLSYLDNFLHIAVFDRKEINR